MSTQCETGDRDRQTTATATERLTYREDGDVLEAIDALVETDAYPNRSEAVRDATRQLVSAESWGENE